jgi:alpha-mannosidase
MAFDHGRGGLKRLKDKRNGQEILGKGKGLGIVQMTNERPTGMSSWVIGAEPEEPVVLLTEYCRVHRVARNEGTSAPIADGYAYIVEQKLQVPGGRSAVTLKATVHGLAPRIDFELEVDWREIGTPATGIPGLEVAFDGVPGVSTRYETPFGTVDRVLPEGAEVPTLRFAHGFDGYGVTVLQDSKYGHARCGDKLTFRVVRSSYDPDPTPEVGEQTVRFSVLLHDSQPTRAELVREATAWNHPLLVVPAPMGEGVHAAANSLVSVEGEGVVLTSLKAGEDGGLVIRLAEYEGRESVATVKLNSLLAAGLTKAESVDMMETPDGGEVSFSDGVVRLTLPANGIRTVKLT